MVTIKTWCFRLLTVPLICVLAYAAASTKGRTFNGTSDRLQSAATINLTGGNVITISIWVNETFANDSGIMLETSANYSANNGSFLVIPNQADGNFGFRGHQTNDLECHITRPSSGAWHHYALVLDTTMGSGTANRCKAFVDGGADSAVTDVNTANAGAFGNYTLNVGSRNAASNFWAGSLSDIAIYTSALSQANAQTLAGCGDPASVGGGPAFWWPIKQVSPETPDAGGVNLNVTGTTNAASGCAGGGGNGTMMLLGVGR